MVGGVIVAFKPFVKVKTDDSNLNRLQDRIVETVNPIVSNTILDCRLIQSISLKSGQVNSVSHRLGRNYQSAVPILYGRADVWIEPVNNSPGLVILLRTSADCTIDLLIF